MSERNEFYSYYLSPISHTHETVIQGKLNGNSVIIASIYCTDKNIPKWIDNIIKYAEVNKLGLILAGDSNAHSDLWGNDSVETSNKGKQLEELNFLNNLRLHNTGKTPTFRNSRNHTSWIDLTLSKGLKSEIENWTVNDHVMNYLDHNTITFSLRTQQILSLIHI